MRYFRRANLVFYFCHEQLSGQHALELPEVDDGQDEGASVHECFKQSADVAHPVEHAVDLPIDNGQVQVEFEGDCYLHGVRQLVGPLGQLRDLEDLRLALLSERAPLPDTILQLELGALDLKCDFLSDLAVNRDPVGAGLVRYFELIELGNNEPSSVRQSEDVLVVQPGCDLFVTLALDGLLSSALALLKLNLEDARPGCVIVALQLEVV